LTYTPNPGFSGSDSFTYTASNAAGVSNPGTVNVTVSPPPLSVSNVSANIPFNSTGIAVPATVNNQSGSYTLHAATQPQHGTITTTSSGFVYKPTTNYSGTDSFTYTASDTRGQSTPATVNLNVAGAPQPTFTTATVLSAVTRDTNFLQVQVSYTTTNAPTVTIESPDLRSGVSPYPPVSSLTGPASGTVYLIVAKPSSPGTYPITLTANGLSGTKTTATVKYTVT
jgi:hypothetical protein